MSPVYQDQINQQVDENMLFSPSRSYTVLGTQKQTTTKLFFFFFEFMQEFCCNFELNLIMADYKHTGVQVYMVHNKHLLSLICFLSASVMNTVPLLYLLAPYLPDGDVKFQYFDAEQNAQRISQRSQKEKLHELKKLLAGFYVSNIHYYITCKQFMLYIFSSVT